MKCLIISILYQVNITNSGKLRGIPLVGDVDGYHSAATAETSIADLVLPDAERNSGGLPLRELG
ncbi:MAG: hypothetical protein QGI86_21695 [Candidatus Poribacteria bacterium]|nr:hypothetical protein [Candidatus Poribacteria bacterium]MDP6749289.1 hypothetical protein [Candidatus Poribacteria bacterium]MDP6962213.1 hypothetical protein [Dehalococcoidia bacterium]